MGVAPVGSTAVESTDLQLYGCQGMSGELRRVLVKRPSAADLALWEVYGWRAEPDPARLAAEHEAFCELLSDAGAEVILGAERVSGNPDVLYTYDPALVAHNGAIVLRPGKQGRRAEPEALAADLGRAGVPIAAWLEAPATAEGGDTLWLDDGTLLVGVGYRTNEESLAAFEAAFPGVDVVAFDLPHWNGAGQVMHLLSFISPLDSDLALVYPRIAPVRLLRLLAERGTRVLEVPDEEFESQGTNVLALGPRRALALEGNPETQRLMERAGVDVVVYRGEEISRKGDGGPTCLTRPLLRG
jgi:dimethylargininase